MLLRNSQLRWGMLVRNSSGRGPMVVRNDSFGKPQLPGIIPRVICLVVDFSTGCIYKSSHVARRAPRDEPSPQGLLAQAEVAIDGASVAKSESDIDPRGRLRLVWERGVDS